MDCPEIKPMTTPSFLRMCYAFTRQDAFTESTIVQIHAPHRIKRSIDIFGSLVLLLFVSPVLICLAVAALACYANGNILFRQERVGQNGRMFACLKFRTMCRNAEDALRDILDQDPVARLEWATTRKLKDDPRVTRFGRFLRSTSLDELPQLWNVLVGDMSLVGPRPVTQTEVDGPYTLFGGRQDYLSIRPGVTGLWQVSGRSGLSYEKRVSLDKHYVRNISLIGDLVILFRTGIVLFRRDGAY